MRFTDILGRLKSFAVSASELDDAFTGGMGFDGSSITGFNAVEESDMIAMPDPSTFAVLPWSPDEHRVARIICDVQTPEKTPYEGDPRYILRRAVKRMQDMGFDTFNVGPRARVLPLQGQQGHRGPRRGRLLRPDRARRRIRRPPAHLAGA